MNLKLTLARRIRLKAPQGASPRVDHPLAALAVLAMQDALVGYSPNPTAVYAGALAGVYLNGVSPISAVSDPWSGLMIVGPNGTVAFKVNRVVHRVVTCQDVENFGTGQDDQIFTLASTLWDNPAALSTVARMGIFIDKPVGSSVYYYNPNPQVSGGIALENKGFISNNSQFSDVPGYSRGSRTINHGRATLLDTSVELSQPAGLPNVGVLSVGRSVGYVSRPLDVTNYLTLGGGAGQTTTEAQYITTWDIQIDDNTIQDAMATSGSVFACFADTVSSADINVQIDATIPTLYHNVDAGIPSAPGVASGLAINIGTLINTNPSFGGSFSGFTGVVRDYAGAIDPVASMAQDTQVYAQLNAQDFDSVQVLN